MADRVYQYERFAVADAHRELIKDQNLRDVLGIKEIRTLSKHLEFSFEGQVYQIQTKHPIYAMRGVKVEIRLKNGLKVYY